MYDKYLLRDILFLELTFIRGVNEVREWEDLGMDECFPVRRKRGVSRPDELGPARRTVDLKQSEVER